MVQTVDEEIVITRNGSPAAVMISPSEYESLKETADILADTGLMDEIRNGLQALKDKKARLYSLEELFD
jgi:prevent-host-death family protein